MALNKLETLPIAHHAWGRERRLLVRGVRIAFGIAGCLWLPLVVFDIDRELQRDFLQRQYQLYMFLLVLWGYDWRRQLRRAESILQLASEHSCPPDRVQWSDIEASTTRIYFDVLIPRSGLRSMPGVLITWLCSGASIVWLVKQLIAIAIIL